MLEMLKQLVADLHGGNKHPNHFEADDYRVAAAALLVHVATLDGELAEATGDKLRETLKTQFELDDEHADELIAAATEADREAVDFFHLTNLLMRSLNEQGRMRVIEMLWEVALADGRISEFEDNMLWRIADLLGVAPNDRIAMRQQVEKKRKAAQNR